MTFIKVQSAVAVHLGWFASQEEAAEMYDRAAICVRGSEAILTNRRSQYDDDDLPESPLSNRDELTAVLARFKDEDSLHRYCAQLNVSAQSSAASTIQSV